jgi:hypothetical protein
MLTKEEWTRGPATPSVKGLVWFTDDGGDRRWSLWGVFGKKAQDLSRKHATVFQAEVYAILACVYEIHTKIRPEKYISICPGSHATLKVIATANTSPLV